ncbi:hypothetical protein C2845_PM13G18490 [Panicum miliaceum]|uniref:MATH domain-containing protein n=1 Tax=Panicum miliaceum TaxID=4540 RepID=A0A3L6RIN9_PANMI|nr:hypothetical protein C2845_PM13G18490 [Panicum miliaceum]
MWPTLSPNGWPAAATTSNRKFAIDSYEWAVHYYPEKSGDYVAVTLVLLSELKDGDAGQEEVGLRGSPPRAEAAQFLGAVEGGPGGRERQVLSTLLRDEVISKARIPPEDSLGAPSFTISKTSGQASGHEELLNGMELAAASLQLKTRKHILLSLIPQVENVKQQCLPNALNYPMLEEYDFRNDTVNPGLDMELKPQARPRPY